MISLLFFLVLIQEVDSICNCATYITSKSDGYVIRRLTGCEDHELQTECQRAEWEMVDYVNGVMNYARTIIIAHPDPKEEVDGDNMAQLSLALEKYRPVPDCSTGLFTTTPSKFLKDRSVLEPSWDESYDDDDDISEDFCVSKYILAECEKAQAEIGSYITKVTKHLDDSVKVSPTFKKVIKTRLEDSILPTISCKTTKHIKFKIQNNSSNLIISSLIIVISWLFVL